METKDIGWAVDQMKHHVGQGRVRRSGWNGKGMWIELATEFDTAGTTCRPSFIVMKTAQGGWVPWVASQTDILATDWEIAA